MRLDFAQGRVIGSMIEKAMTTPANYPMSLNAVVVACNQVSNRDPVCELDEGEVERVLRGLADDGLAKMVHRPGDRVVKYRHALDDVLATNPEETALLAVLLLRGAQTPGELRQRTGRYVEFAGLDALEAVLGELQHRGLVERLGRQPGQKESRYRELLTAGTAAPAPVAGDATAAEPTEPAPMVADSAAPADGPQAVPARDVAAELDDLKRRFEELLHRLGEDIE